MFNEKEADCAGKKGVLVEIAYIVDEDSPSFTTQVAPKGVGGRVAWPEPGDGMNLHRWYKICCCCGGDPKKTWVEENTELFIQKSPDTRFSILGMPHTAAPPNASKGNCFDLN